MYEPLSAKFERISELYDVHLDETEENFMRLKSGKIDLSGKEKPIAQLLNGHLASYNETWADVDSMCRELFSADFRERYTDDLNNPWIFSWFCMDHIGYQFNPRRKSVGYHIIYDYYLEKISQFGDSINWHFHPPSFFREGHRNATSYLNNTDFIDGLVRKVIDRNFFPSVYRAGYQTERPDLNFLLEQWIPFDLSNTAKEGEDLTSSDMVGGRYNDWRLAPTDWRIYSPHHDYYQLEGGMRRKIGRCLNICNRFANIDEREVAIAFERANKNLPTLLAIAGHDYRQLKTEVETLYTMLYTVRKHFPDVSLYFVKDTVGFQHCLGYEKAMKNTKFNINVSIKKTDHAHKLFVETSDGAVFGPQPFLAIRLLGNRYIHDNFDFSKDLKSWSYTFDEHTVPFSAVSEIGVAANDRFGRTLVKKIKVNHENKITFQLS